MKNPTTPDHPPRKRIFLHIGAPKTGTTWLQGVLFDNREALAADGVLYPYTDRAQSRRSMLDFRGINGNTPHATTRGEWDLVAQRAREWDGHAVVISNEIFGLASARRIGRGLAALTDDEHPGEVHVVFTARDFARQLVSDWQEQVKHKHTVTLETFVSDLAELGLDAPPPFGQMFWGLHDAGHVLRKWSQHVPVEQIHLITLPPPGGPKDALWSRFCEVVGMGPESYPTDTRRSNTSMGVAETEFVRRLNRDVRSLPTRHYDPLVRVFLAEQALGNKSAKLTLPSKWLPWTQERTEQLLTELDNTGYHVVGDLSDLHPRPEDHEPHLHPDDVTDAQLAESSMRANVALLDRVRVLRNRVNRLERDLEMHPSPPRRSITTRLRGRLAKNRWAIRAHHFLHRR